MNSNSYSSLDPNPDGVAREAHVPMTGWGPNQAIQEIRELPDGYALLVAENPIPLLMVLELFKPDHLAYRFLRIEVEDQAEDGSTWVHVTGSDGVKGYLRSALLFDDDSAQPEPAARAVPR